nr:MAG TPA: Protein of unknown function (DUF658) [Caudoviricetes sp.]
MAGEYVLYKGEEIVGIGTADELSRRLGLRPQTIRSYSSPSHMRRVEESADPESRIVAVRVKHGKEDDGDDSEKQQSGD